MSNRKKQQKENKSQYDLGYKDGMRDIIKALFTMDVITIEKISEISKFSIKEIQEFTQK